MKFELAEIIILLALVLYIFHKIGNLGAAVGEAVDAADTAVMEGTGSTVSDWFGMERDPNATPEQQAAMNYVTGWSFWNAIGLGVGWWN